MKSRPPNSDVFEIEIAGMPLQLRSARIHPALRERFLTQYGSFLRPPQEETPVVEVRDEPGDLFMTYQVGGDLQLYTRCDDGRVTFESHLERGWYQLAGCGQGELLMRPQGDPENFLRVVYAWRAQAARGLLLHAAGIIRKGRAFVFFGPSGSGKTTITALSSGDTVLSDDMVIVRLEGGGWRAYGVPFRGDMPEAPRTNADAPLAGLYSLVKDDRNSLRPLSGAEAAARLTACVPFVMTDHASVLHTVVTCERLNESVPVKELHFRREVGFWKVIDGE